MIVVREGIKKFTSSAKNPSPNPRQKSLPTPFQNPKNPKSKNIPPAPPLHIFLQPKLRVLKLRGNTQLHGPLPKLPMNSSLQCIDLRQTNVGNQDRNSSEYNAIVAEYLRRVNVALLPWPNFRRVLKNSKCVFCFKNCSLTRNDTSIVSDYGYVRCLNVPINEMLQKCDYV